MGAFVISLVFIIAVLGAGLYFGIRAIKNFLLNKNYDK